MAEFKFYPPGHFSKSIYSCIAPSENYRLKSLLILLGCGHTSKRNDPKKNKLSTSFLQLPFKSATNVKINDIVNLFAGYKRSEIDNFFKNSVSKNIKLQKNVYYELLNSVGYNEHNNQIPCFLSIYRIIEQIALCLPIISIIEKATFQVTFTEYKQLIDGKAKSDLSVLKKYSENVLNSSIGDSNIEFNFSGTTKPVQNVNIIKGLLPSDKLANIVVSETTDTIELKNKYLHYLIIGFRNQYFHYLFHEKNISHDDLEFPEEFLKICNPHFLNYYSFLFFDLLKAELSIWC